MSRAPQVVVFHPRHRSAVLDGSKTVTVRWNESITVGPASFVFGGSNGGAVDGHVLSVARWGIDGLTAEAAQADTGTDMGEFVGLLRQSYYPQMPPDAELDVVVFRLAR